ncbi:sensor histidine kinase [Chryseobacterium nematophagum]|uniref:histidine kinase n=1 Tax=Chryseobacterium nematophagum TaxID=2305228 RepID=A0A3M7L705_9FLAO|nr:HAMP domain-containing sensor histidine kinase [Chryseobacterium nematophagum]RMZ58377.1 sensor histidine kinase [Chryseobacterium nematophagum]
MRKSIISRLNNWIIFVVMTAVVAIIVIASTSLINYLRKEEIKRINLLSKAIRIQQEVKAPDTDVLDLLPEILNINNNIPFIVTDKNKQPILDLGFSRNIPEVTMKDPQKLNDLMKEMEKNYTPIEIKVPDGNNQFVYYDNSHLLNNLRYSPYILGLFILLYFGFSFWFFKTLKKTDEGYLWVGLAKETAHQIGTPLSSMIGWMEIMKLENPDSEGVHEIEKDIERLKTISERFSKIGSVPELNNMDFNETVRENYNYLKSRISNKINFNLYLPSRDILVPHNKILMSWVIENLVKNAVDAMKGEGKLKLSVYERNKNILIEVKDNGSGMTKQQARSAFKPGYSTKKRGWGLGLSLAKRVIKEYHNGDIKIAQTDVGKGTVFRISFKKTNEIE